MAPAGAAAGPSGVLQTEGDVSATLEGAPLDTAIEIARGDVIQVGGVAPFELRVLG